MCQGEEVGWRKVARQSWLWGAMGVHWIITPYASSPPSLPSTHISGPVH